MALKILGVFLVMIPISVLMAWFLDTHGIHGIKYWLLLTLGDSFISTGLFFIGGNK